MAFNVQPTEQLDPVLTNACVSREVESPAGPAFSGAHGLSCRVVSQEPPFHQRFAPLILERLLVAEQRRGRPPVTPCS